MLDPHIAESILNAAAQIDKARAAYRKRQPDQAIKRCVSVLALPGIGGDQIDDAYRIYTDTLTNQLNAFDEVSIQADNWLATTPTDSGKVDALVAKAEAMMRIGNVGEARRLNSDANTAAAAASYTRGMAAAARQRGDLLWQRGENEKALIVLRQAVETFESLNDIPGQVLTLISLGIVYHMLSRYYPAIQTYLKAAALSDAIGDQTFLWIAYNNVGESYQQIYAMDKALDYHRKAASFVSHLDADLTRNLGLDLVAVGQKEEGLAKLREALEIGRRSEKDIELQALNSLADALFTTGDIAESRALAAELLDSARQMDYTRHMIRAVLILGRCAQVEGDMAAANKYFQDGFIMAQKTGETSVLWQIHAALADMLVASQPAIAAVHRTIAGDLLDSLARSIEDRGLREQFRREPSVARILRDYEHDDD